MAVGLRKNSFNLYWVKEVFVVLVQALILALIVQVFLFQPFNIPSGSMKQTLLVGDYLFVSKYAYGYSRYSAPYTFNFFRGRVFGQEPERGDVVVFRLPADDSIDYIKRVIGLPGDKINIKGGVVFINDEEVQQKRDGYFRTRESGHLVDIPRYIETLPNGVSYHILDSEENGFLDNEGPYEVPPGHFFVMGDNRDNSTDSRALWKVGYIPYENLVGRAEMIFYSYDSDGFRLGSWLSPWQWTSTIRWGRLFKLVR